MPPALMLPITITGTDKISRLGLDSSFFRRDFANRLNSTDSGASRTSQADFLHHDFSKKFMAAKVNRYLKIEYGVISNNGH